MWNSTAAIFLVLGALAATMAPADTLTTAPTAGAILQPFGIGACNQTSQELPRWVPQMAAIDLHVMRTARLGWGSVEPQEGQWNWTQLDAQMNYLTDQHFTFGGLLYSSPRWNTQDRPGTLPVNNITGWSNYVSHVVEHAKDKVKYWEVWNEPPNGTGRDQTPADYAKLMVATYTAAKAADPACSIGLAAKSVHVNYLEKVIQAGAKDHFDYIVLHPYEVLNGIADNVGTEAIYMHIVPTVRAMLAAQDPARANVPIIFTELGTDARKGTAHQAHALVKAYAMGIAQGVGCIQWFEGMDGDSGPMGLLERNATPRPAYTAMAQMIQHLGQHPTYLGWLLLHDKHYAFVFQGAQTTVLATWAYKGIADQVDFGAPVQIVDPLTGQSASARTYDLTAAPILVLGVAENLVAQARANKDQPLPWGGDYRAAQSVSITMGERNTEKGLHTLAGDAVAAAVLAYGGSARAGSVPGGNMFMVDPEFLSYTTTPLEITVVVRRNAANDNAGFKLVYESTNGFKNCGWYTVPDNKQWYTKTWRIDDAQFINYWGYNFALDSDGKQYNKYFIQSVTVTKCAR